MSEHTKLSDAILEQFLVQGRLANRPVYTPKPKAEWEYYLDFVLHASLYITIIIWFNLTFM